MLSFEWVTCVCVCVLAYMCMCAYSMCSCSQDASAASASAMQARFVCTSTPIFLFFPSLPQVLADGTVHVLTEDGIVSAALRMPEAEGTFMDVCEIDTGVCTIYSHEYIRIYI